jgi:hypothetical protein
MSNLAIRKVGINMIRKKQSEVRVIDLTGPEGNAFYLMAYANKNARKIGLVGASVIEEMKQGNYEHLVETFDRYFGDYVILER